MLLVLRLYPVWRWNAEALKVTSSFAGTSTHRQNYRVVFLFFGRFSKRRRGRQVVRQRSAKPVKTRGSTWFQ
jgi:hypothetical protein